MKQARYKEPLPLAVIEAARAGDAGAVEQVLQYYNGYISALCSTRWRWVKCRNTDPVNSLQPVRCSPPSRPLHEKTKQRDHSDFQMS